MKSERRHDLQHNELLVWLEKTSGVVKPYTNTILIGLIVIVGTFVAVRLLSVRSGDTTARAWDSFFAAMNSGETASLDEVAENFSSNEVGDWARVVSADLRLAVGCDQLFGDKIVAGQELQKAMESYVAVLEASNDSSIRERATFGLARAYEAMAATRQSQGELKKAEEKYQEVVDQWAEGVYAKSAQRRLEDLGRAETKEFYDQFAAYDPKPAYDPLSNPVGDLPFDAGSLTPGSMPPEFSDLLNSPGLSGDDDATDDAKDDAMDTGDEEKGDQEKGDPTDSKEESDSPPDGQPALEPVEKGSDADSPEKSETSPPPAEPPAKTDPK